MKIFTNKFLSKNLGGRFVDATKENAEKAQKIIGLPKELWLELSKESKNSILVDSLEDNAYTIFMAGVAVGWAEKNDNVK